MISYENIDECKSLPGFLCVYKIYNDDESCLLISATRDTNQHWAEYSDCRQYYRMKKLLEIKCHNFGTAFNIQQFLLKVYRSQHYSPSYQFDGYAECLNVSVRVLRRMFDECLKNNDLIYLSSEK